MGIVFRQSAKNIVVSALGAMLGALVIWLSTKYTTKQQLGFTSNLTKYAVSLSQIFLIGVNSTLVVYIHRYLNDDRKRKSLITLSFAIPAIAMGIFTIAYFSLKSWILAHFQPDDIPFMRRYFMWLPVLTVFFIYMIILEQYLGSQLKVAVSAFMREVVLRIANISLILLYGFGYVGFDVLVIGTVITYSLPVLMFLLIALKLENFGFIMGLKHLSAEEYKEMGHFSWYHFLLGSSIVMIN
jgi:hypothetical protein